MLKTNSNLNNRAFSLCCFPPPQPQIQDMVSCSQSPSPSSALNSFCPREHQSKAMSMKYLGAQAAIDRKVKLPKNSTIT